jgi:site-specific recombinase XerD
MSHNIERWKTEFLEYTEIEKGRSLKTIENYDRYLSRFISFAKVTNPEKITDDILRNYRLIGLVFCHSHFECGFGIIVHIANDLG